MRVWIHKLLDDTLSVLVQPSPGSRMSPVMIQGVTAENVVAQTLPVIEGMRRRGKQDPDDR